MMTQHLLFEIGCEELPAQGLENLAQHLLSNTTAQLSKHGLSFGTDAVYYATPRRLSLFIPDCQTQQAAQTSVRKGPKLAQAILPDGTPSPAALGFAKSCNVTFGQLDNDGECLVFHQRSEGHALIDLLPELLTQAVVQLPIARPMRWGNRSQGFARPVKWLCALLGADIIPVTLFGVKADRYSYGHRFMAPQAICFDSACQASYEQALQSAHVIASFDKRRECITQQLPAETVLDQALLNEVTGLVEWPVALRVPFDERFLNLPKEVLIASMQQHQKCFAVQNPNGSLQAAFITISNIDSKDPQDVIHGNARVMQARLSDAEFFYQQDLKIPLAQHQHTLAQMTFQQALGSMSVKVAALTQLCERLAPLLGADASLARQAAQLAKNDLCSHMVGEFPELQGLMGKTYAVAQSIDPQVADALYEQYLPRFAGDALPSTPVGCTVALADRLLTLVAIFGIHQAPSGTKDPFALRRMALGVIRLLLNHATHISLAQVLQWGVDSWQAQGVTFESREKAVENSELIMQTGLPVTAEVMAFIRDRARHFWGDQAKFQPYPQAIIAIRPFMDDMLDAEMRLQALVAFQQQAETASALASAHKRVNNFLSKRQADDATVDSVNAAMFEKAVEQHLWDSIQTCQKRIAPLLAARDYMAVLQQLALLKQPIDDFFEHVMVLAEASDIRRNRLAVLSQLRLLLSSVADLSHLM